MNIIGLNIRLPRLKRTEKRKAERSPIYQTLFLDYHSPSHSKKGVAEGKDMSATGIRFACSTKFPKGTRLELELKLPSEYGEKKIIRAQTHVIRCYKKLKQNRYRIACRFDRLDAETRSEIQSFVAWLDERERRYLYL